MTRHDAITVVAVCLGLVSGCSRSQDESEVAAAAGKTEGSSPASATRPAATGTLKVTGKGTDLIRVFGASADKPLVVASTGGAVTVPAGPCTVELNKIRKKAEVAAGRETVVPAGTLAVTGLKKDLFEIWDQAGKTKLNFKYTGGEMELFEGTYVVRLNNSSQKAVVRNGERTVVETGSVTVAGTGRDLFYVFDESGKTKLGFTSVGKPMELLPGTYTVTCKGEKHRVVVVPGEGTVVGQAATTSQAAVGPSRDQKMWALATVAVLTERNKRRHDLLGFCERTDKNNKSWQRSLQKWWGIKSRQDLLKGLQWVENGGHRKHFSELGAYLSSLTEEELQAVRSKVKDNPEDLNDVEMALKHHGKLGEKSLVGWDYARYVGLCGWGYLLGYLTEDEAWERIMPVASMLQKTFDSWEDLGRNYLIGRAFWSLEETTRQGEQYEQAYKKLLTDPKSPWLRYEWNMNLTFGAAASQKNGA